MPTVSLDSDPSEPFYLSYQVETNPSEPSYPSVICLTSESSSSFAASRHVPPSVHGREFIRTRVMPRGCGRAWGRGHGDVTLRGFGNGFLLPDEWRGDCMLSWVWGYPFLVVVIKLSFYCLACLGFRDFWCIFPLWYIKLGFFYRADSRYRTHRYLYVWLLVLLLLY